MALLLPEDQPSSIPLLSSRTKPLTTAVLDLILLTLSKRNRERLHHLEYSLILLTIRIL